MGPGTGRFSLATLMTVAGVTLAVAVHAALGANVILSVMLLALILSATAISLLVGRLTEARRARQRSDARFAIMFEASPLPTIIVRETDIHVVDVNDAFLAAFGWKREELIGQPARLMRLYPKMNERKRLLALWQTHARVRNFEICGRCKTGEMRTLLVSIDRVMIDGVPHAQTLMNDITERKQAEAAVRESDARFRAITENIDEVFWITQVDQRIVYASPAFDRIWGRSRDDLYRSADAWAESIHPNDRAGVLESVAARCLAGVDFTVEYRILRPDGTVRWIHDRGSPVRDENGKVVRFVGLAEDITDRRTLEEQFRQAQKMESLGLLAGGVAHDFNNVLAVIASCNGMLAEEIEKESSSRELVDDIDGAVNRATALTRQLLAFSRKQVTEPRVVDLNQIVNETRKMLRRMVGEDVMLATSLDPALGHVRVDPGYLVQVLMNLAVNARDAMPRGGRLSLTTRNTTMTEEDARRHPGVKAGPAIVLLVEDTGCGMTSDVRTRIFEPFFTTKPMGSGTGMGLAVVHGIVDQAGGFIEVDSQPGVGTTFRVVLPIIDAKIDELDEIAGIIPFGVESILMVDDDEHVRRATARALRTHGYTVIEASSGKAALDVLAAREPVHLLLTDVVMPEMDGRQLGELAAQRQPDLKVLYMSGYTDDAVMRHGVMHGAVNLIEKPFRLDSLARKVRLVLDRETAVSAGGSAEAAVG